MHIPVRDVGKDMRMTSEEHDGSLPGQGLDYGRMPGHWLLAQMGKRVLRPGGLELTREMLAALDIRDTDEVVEFAPGLGVTARAALERNPVSYTGVERDENAARRVGRYLNGPGRKCLVGRAESTGLPAESATVVYAEAMLSMQTASQKEAIVQEAARLLKPGGRYGIHELCLLPEELDESKKSEIGQALSASIHVGARPLTLSEWSSLLERHGFDAAAPVTTPMHLLEPGRFIRDEGIIRTVGFVWRVATKPAARRRILKMRSTFRAYAEHIGGISIVGVKRKGT